MNNQDMGKNMGKMETSITDLQGELDVANKPSKNHFKPGWFLIVVIVAFMIGLGTFFATSRFVKVDNNTEAIIKQCEFRNDQLKLLNLKFGQLVLLFDASFESQPPTEKVLALYNEFKEPLELQNCSKVINT